MRKLAGFFWLLVLVVCSFPFLWRKMEDEDINEDARKHRIRQLGRLGDDL